MVYNLSDFLERMDPAVRREAAVCRAMSGLGLACQGKTWSSYALPVGVRFPGQSWREREEGSRGKVREGWDRLG